MYCGTLITKMIFDVTQSTVSRTVVTISTLLWRMTRSASVSAASGRVGEFVTLSCCSFGLNRTSLEFSTRAVLRRL